MTKNPFRRSGIMIKSLLLILVLLLGFGCAHTSESDTGKGPNSIQGATERQESPFIKESEEKSTATWDDVFDDIGFLLRWLDGNTIIFP